VIKLNSTMNHHDEIRDNDDLPRSSKLAAGVVDVAPLRGS